MPIYPNWRGVADGIADEQLAIHLSRLPPHDLQRFVTSMTDADLSAVIDFLRELTHDDA